MPGRVGICRSHFTRSKHVCALFWPDICTGQAYTEIHHGAFNCGVIPVAFKTVFLVHFQTSDCITVHGI